MALGHNVVCACGDCTAERLGRSVRAGGLVVEVNDAPAPAPAPAPHGFITPREMIRRVMHLAYREIDQAVAQASDEELSRRLPEAVAEARRMYGAAAVEALLSRARAAAGG